MTSLKIGNESVPFSDIKAFEPLNDPPYSFGIAIVTHDGRYYLAGGFSKSEPRDDKLKELRDVLLEQHEQQHQEDHEAPGPRGNLAVDGADAEDDADDDENQGDGKHG
jgi:hypothetical protein